jgi:hypothetical protein
MYRVIHAVATNSATDPINGYGMKKTPRTIPDEIATTVRV